MFNLLPEQNKVALRKEYNFRRALMYVFGIIAIVIVSIGFLIPAFVVAYYRYHSAQIQYDSVAHSRDGSEQVYIKDIKKTNSFLTAFKDTQDPRSVEIFKLIADNKPVGVRINQLGYVRGVTIRIHIEGVADSRDSLRLLTKKLSQVKGFQVGELPISEFVSDSSIPFSLDITFTPHA